MSSRRPQGSRGSSLSCCAANDRWEGSWLQLTLEKWSSPPRADNSRRSPWATDPVTLLSLVKLNLDGVQTAGRTMMSHSISRTSSY
jgi:hypothetical protein